MGDVWTLVRTLRALEADKKIIKEVAAELRKPVPTVRTRIKNTALPTLPNRGGLNVWVAGIRITASVTLRGRGAGLRLRGGRRSLGSQSDIRAIDRGRVRHPSWGRRFRGQWFTQTVTPGFFSKTAAESPEWDPAIQRAMDKAVSTVHA